jgi:hypothetical protein
MVISENGLLKKPGGHIAYAPPNNNIANVAKKIAPARDWGSRSSNRKLSASERQAAVPCGRASLLPGHSDQWLRAYCGG